MSFRVQSWGVVVLLLFSAETCRAQIFQNAAPSLGILQYNWDGHYGAAVSTADWNNDGWPDLTLGNSDGTLRSFVNNEGQGFDIVPLPWHMEGETKAIL